MELANKLNKARDRFSYLTQSEQWELCEDMVHTFGMGDALHQTSEGMNSILEALYELVTQDSPDIAAKACDLLEVFYSKYRECRSDKSLFIALAALNAQCKHIHDIQDMVSLCEKMDALYWSSYANQSQASLVILLSAFYSVVANTDEVANRQTLCERMLLMFEQAGLNQSVNALDFVVGSYAAHSHKTSHYQEKVEISNKAIEIFKEYENYQSESSLGCLFKSIWGRITEKECDFLDIIAIQRGCLELVSEHPSLMSQESLVYVFQILYAVLAKQETATEKALTCQLTLKLSQKYKELLSSDSLTPLLAQLESLQRSQAEFEDQLKTHTRICNLFHKHPEWHSPTSWRVMAQSAIALRVANPGADIRSFVSSIKTCLDSDMADKDEVFGQALVCLYSLLDKEFTPEEKELICQAASQLFEAHPALQSMKGSAVVLSAYRKLVETLESNKAIHRGCAVMNVFYNQYNQYDNPASQTCLMVAYAAMIQKENDPGKVAKSVCQVMDIFNNNQAGQDAENFDYVIQGLVYLLRQQYTLAEQIWSCEQLVTFYVEHKEYWSKSTAEWIYQALGYLSQQPDSKSEEAQTRQTALTLLKTLAQHEEHDSLVNRVMNIYDLEELPDHNSTSQLLTCIQ